MTSVFALATLHGQAKDKSLPAKTEAEKHGLQAVVVSSPSAEKHVLQEVVVSGPPTVHQDPIQKSSLAPSPLKLQEGTAASEEIEDTWKLGRDNPHRPHLMVGVGYVNSNWKKFSNNLKNGSLNYDIGFEREWMPAVEGGLHFSFMDAATNNAANENVREFHVAMHTRFLLMPGKMRPFVGLGIGVGSYRIWSLNTETASTISYNKHSEGAILGVFPEVGMRFIISNQTFFDLCGGYAGFLDHPRSRIGGASLLLRFGLTH